MNSSASYQHAPRVELRLSSGKCLPQVPGIKQRNFQLFKLSYIQVLKTLSYKSPCLASQSLNQSDPGHLASRRGRGRGGATLSIGICKCGEGKGEE